MRRAQASTASGADGGDALELLQALWALNHALGSHSWRTKRELGVTGVERTVLRCVGARPGITPGELARFLHLHPSTLTAVLRRLVERRLLSRRPDAQDARRGRLALAARGVVLDGVRRDSVEERVRAALDRLPPRDVRSAATVLVEVRRALDGPVRNGALHAVRRRGA